MRYFRFVGDSGCQLRKMGWLAGWSRANRNAAVGAGDVDGAAETLLAAGLGVFMIKHKLKGSRKRGGGNSRAGSGSGHETLPYVVRLGLQPRMSLSLLAMDR